MVYKNAPFEIFCYLKNCDFAPKKLKESVEFSYGAGFYFAIIALLLHVGAVGIASYRELSTKQFAGALLNLFRAEVRNSYF